MGAVEEMCVFLMGHSGNGCELASTLCRCYLRKGVLFVLSWARVQRVDRKSVSSELLMWWRCAHFLLLSPVARRLEKMDVCI